ncbi:MAG: dinitrogenase iron-molybdenum cofactor biosynthesis protein [Thermodesulfobacteriota bacterium]
MKVLIPILGEQVAPRFDLAVEVAIAEAGAAGAVTGEPRIVLMPAASADELCALILKEGGGLVLCGAIEEGHFQYLSWKKIRVIDRVVGPWRLALERVVAGRLQPGEILRARQKGRKR